MLYRKEAPTDDLVVRMAVLYDLLTHGPAGVQAAALHEIEVA